MKKFGSIIFTMFLVFSIHAQSAEAISQILESDVVTVGQVCYISAVEQGLISERSSLEDAVLALEEIGQIKPGMNKDDRMPVVNIAFIMAQLWEIKGGLMFRITKGSPRYAFKEFKSTGVILEDTDPGDYISGAEFLSMYTAGLSVYGGFNIDDVSMEID